MGMMPTLSPLGGTASGRHCLASVLMCACVLVCSSSATAQASRRLSPETHAVTRSYPGWPNKSDLLVRSPVTASQQAHAASANVPAKYDLKRIGSRGVGKGLNLYSVTREREIGRRLAKQADSKVRLVSDPIVIDYVARLAQRLVAHSDLKVPLHVKVIDDDDMNIFTLPGGFLYVNTGLLLATQSEAELAGAIAHEVAHTAARHATRKATRKRLFHVAIMPLSLISGGAADLLLDRFALMKFSRDSERDADLLGLEYMYAAGYDPTDFVHFFERLRSQEDHVSWIRQLLNTHPATDERILRAQKEIKTILPARDIYVINTSEFDAIKSRLASDTRDTASSEAAP